MQQEVQSFKQNNRLAEIYLNAEHYDEKLNKVEETLFNLNTYLQLINGEVQGLQKQTSSLSS